MKILIVIMVLIKILNADRWNIKRNPFTVSDEYIKQTKKVYLEPKNNYIPFSIKLIGVVYTQSVKEAIFDIEFEGVCKIALNEKKKINTPDIESYLKLIEVSEHYAVVSLNGGEGIRYEIR